MTKKKDKPDGYLIYGDGCKLHPSCSTCPFDDCKCDSKGPIKATPVMIEKRDSDAVKVFQLPR